LKSMAKLKISLIFRSRRFVPTSREKGSRALKSQGTSGVPSLAKYSGSLALVVLNCTKKVSSTFSAKSTFSIDSCGSPLRISVDSKYFFV
uniref:Ovule protein n=1 Tax=Rodentolepis nana TaxID=102285 RepID=A0A0R3SZV4_RODNA